MISVLRFLETVELGGLCVLVVVLFVAGNKLSQGYARVRSFSWGLSGLLFVAYIGVHFVRGSIVHDSLADLAFRGLLGAGFFLGVLWLVLTPLAACFETIVDTLRQWRANIGRMFDNRRRNREADEDRRRREEHNASFTQERKRARQEADEQANLAAGAQKRREDARAGCEVLFVLHCFELQKRFTREMFDAFVMRHLGDDKRPEYVEQRATELCDIIRKHLEKAEGRGKKGLAELAQWFLKEKEQIETTALSDDDKQLLLAQLEGRYVRLQEQYLRGVQP